jgi:shikimate dehydrogenase
LEVETASSGLVVNCTPLGMHGTGSEDESPLPAAYLREGLWVCDLVYRPPLTRLLLEAEAAGANTLGGLEMLVLQAVESVRLWTGREPPVDIMREAARSALGL